MTIKNAIETGATAVLALCAIIATATIVHREFARRDGAPPNEAREVADWREYASGNETMGPAAAPISLVVFSDFQCPFCAKFAETLQQIRKRYPDSLRIVHRNVPITSIHAHALPAAISGECAAEQGAFEAYHDTLFRNQTLLGAKSWGYFAMRAGIKDSAAFERCMQGQWALAQIAKDTAAAARLKIEATPTLMINDLLLARPPALAELDTLVRKQFNSKERRR